MGGQWRSASVLQWPEFPCPPKLYWSQFRTCIHHAFARNHTPGKLTSLTHLNKPLGHWYGTTRHIKYRYHRTEDSAYIHDEHGIHQYTRTTSRKFTHSSNPSRIPPTAHPITASHDDLELWTSCPYNLLSTPIAQNGALSSIVPHPLTAIEEAPMNQSTY